MNTKIVTGGAIGAAIAASACCIGPLVLALLGLGGGALLLKFEPYRPAFLAVTGLILAGAFLITYRMPPVEQCKPGTACAVPASRKGRESFCGSSRGLFSCSRLSSTTESISFSLPRERAHDTKKGFEMKRIASVLMMLAFATAAFAETKTVTLQVKGWVCDVCSSATKLALKKLDGVQDVRVDAEESEAVVIYDDGKITPQKLIQRVEKQGYKATVKPVNSNKK